MLILRNAARLNKIIFKKKFFRNVSTTSEINKVLDSYIEVGINYITIDVAGGLAPLKLITSIIQPYMDWE